MSHEIESAVFMASEGAGWTGLGRAIPLHQAKDPRAIAELCNALWTVETREAFYRDDRGDYVKATGAAMQVRSDNGAVLSVTSDSRYHVDNRQPVDIFEAFRDDMANNGLDISHAAVLRGGAVIAVSAVLPDADLIIGRGDRVKTYVTLSTGYDTKHGTKSTLGGVRVVCANTLEMSIRDALASGKIKTVRASTRLQANSLRDLIRNLDAIQQEEKRTFDALANARMTDADVARYFADVLEINIDDLSKVDRNGKDLVSTKSRNMLDALTAAYRSAPGAAVASGTAWGALNAVTYYATHVKTVRDTTADGAAVARIASNMTGDSARMKSKALAMLAERYAGASLAVAA